jgi:hypothetical protein
MSVTVSGPFTIGPISSPSCTSSHQRGSEPRPRLTVVLRLDVGDLLVGVGLELHVVVLLALARLLAFGPHHQPVLAREATRSVSSRKHLRGPLVNRPARELARLVERGDERVAAEHAAGAGTSAPTIHAALAA